VVKLTSVVVLVLALFRPSIASADTLNMTGLGKGEWVSINVGGVSESGWAGEINWLDNSKSIFTYCVDLFDNALSQQQVTVGTTDNLTKDTDPYTTDQAGGRAAWLFNAYADDIHTTLSNAQAAGLQIAIWQTLYKPGAFTIVASQAALAAADAYLNNAMGRTALAVYLDAARGAGQDQITHTVPEPGTILLVGLGILLMALMANRKMAPQARQMTA
jgi:PEP-CTERM motif